MLRCQQSSTIGLRAESRKIDTLKNVIVCKYMRCVQRPHRLLYRLILGQDYRSGVFISPPGNTLSLHYFPSQWSGYDALAFSVFQDNRQGLRLWCKVYDRQHLHNDLKAEDRYEQEFILDKGWNDLEISLKDVRRAPLGRDMVMDEIVCLQLYVSGDEQVTLYFDTFRLVKKRRPYIPT